LFKNCFLKYFPELAGLLVFLVYLTTMCPTIGEMDSGELATVQATLSIAHPTGYPLFALLGYLFLKLPLPFETIIRLNLLAAFWSAATIVILIRTTKLIIENLSILVGPKWKSFDITVQSSNYIKILVSIFPGFMLGFSLTFWLQSTRVEVYSLQMFLLSLVIYFSICAYISHNSIDSSSNKHWVWAFIFIGLAFANHLTTIFIVLPTIFLFFLKNKLNFQNIRILFSLFFISFVVAVTFYLLMMFRASSNPPFKYGDPSNLISLFDHVTAQRYKGNMFQGIFSFKLQAEKFINLLQFNFAKQKWGEFSLSIFLGVAGIVFSFILLKRFYYYLFLIFFFTLVISFNYNIYDINEYFLPAFYIISLSSGLCILIISAILPKTIAVKFLIFFVSSVLIGAQIYGNYQFADKSNDYFYETNAKNLLESLPQNAILYTDNWSLALSPMLYLQNIKNIRRDVLIFSPYRKICFTPYQSMDVERFFRNNELILNKKVVIFDLDSKGNLVLPTK
jgi:hypothetical protein